jgi:AraC-like DNA-binding protein
MTEFNFSITDYREILQQFGAQLNVPVIHDRLALPATLGSGYLKYLRLPNKQDVMVVDLSLNDGFWINRSRTDKEYYVFVCEQIHSGGELITALDGEEVSRTDEEVSGMYLFSFLSDLRQFAPKGSSVRGFRVIITPEWLASYLRIDKMERVLQRYLQLKAARIHLRPLDLDTVKLLKELLNPSPDLEVDENTYMQNRVMMILEHFFSWMYTEMTQNPRLTKIAEMDIATIRDVEDYLLRDLAHAPAIDELARFCNMSATRLKTLFRQVYGLPPYEYFQQHRMLKAKELLKTTNLSIQDIGKSLGYSNMSNFTLAFRKVFNLNPSSLR